MADAVVASSGLLIHRGSRLERLAALLARQLHAERPDDPLATQCVVVAHPGMKRWLQVWLATADGTGLPPMVAGLELQLPGEWLEREARGIAGATAAGSEAFRRENLRWRIFTALAGFQDEAVDGYLAAPADEAEADAGLRRFQLAERLAGLYAQYLVYRRDWIRRWEAGEDSHWQARLWRAVVSGLDATHRAQQVDRLIRVLERAADDTYGRSVHVFGVSHLPPDLLDVLRVVSLRRPVHLYFPDPCREHWDFIRSHRELLRAGPDAESLYMEIGHPLLAALGRLGQHFSLQLNAEDAIGVVDARDPSDEGDDAAAPTLLGRLQASIRALDPLQVVPEDCPQDDAARQDWLTHARGDASLRVHGCHTRLRELEVLRDALLRMLADDDTLMPRDIVVMAPDIAEYAPLLGAVFGEAGRLYVGADRIPYQIADLGLGSLHPVFRCFSTLLGLVSSRCTLPEILDLLAQAPVMQALDLDAAGLEAARRWLQRARISWGLDANMKAEAGGAAIDLHSWSFGFDRLLAGHLLGREADDVLLDDILPLGGADDSAIAALAAVHALLEELRTLRTMAAQGHTLAEWSTLLQTRLERLLGAAPGDDAAHAALDSLRRLVANLALQSAALEPAPTVGFAIVRQALDAALQAVPEQQRFLAGGMTFCGMVPQRTIPFRVVCLLGMNDSDFPRRASPQGLDLIAAEPRIGDRDTRSEDRYLFLEALMAARDAIHISHVAEGASDGQPRAAALPLAELLGFLDAAHGIDEGDAELDRPWRVAHALQPFDARYFDVGSGDPRLFSYSTEYAAAASHEIEAGPSRRWNWSGTADEGVPAPLSPAALIAYWRDPARALLNSTLGIGLGALEDAALPEVEPLAAALAPIERIERELLLRALVDGQPKIATEAPAWLMRSGLLPAGALGDIAWCGARDLANEALQIVHDCVGPGARLSPLPLTVDLVLDDVGRLTGTLSRLYRSADGRTWVFDAKLSGAVDFRHLLPVYIEWAAARLALPAETPMAPLLIAPGRGGRLAADPRVEAFDSSPELLHDALRELLLMAHAGLQSPQGWFPETAWALAQGAAKRSFERARSTWNGSGGIGGERDRGLGHAGFLLGDTHPLDDPDLRAGLWHVTEQLCHMLGLEDWAEALADSAGTVPGCDSGDDGE